MATADVDIDTPTTFKPSTIFPWARASLVKDGDLQPHPCGYYPEAIPVDVVSGLAAIPYQEVEEIGYTKVDFLHLQLLDNFSSRQEIDALLELEPDWSLLTNPNAQKKLFQLSKHGDILDAIAPTCIEELADVLALIRPGKKQLVKLYKAQRESTRRMLYAKGEDGYQFKRSHAVAYAMNIVLQLHLISAGVL